MSNVLHSPPTQNAVQKTLDAQLDQGHTTAMTLNNVTGIQNRPGVVVLNRVNSSGVEQEASNREYVEYTGTSGSTLTGLTRGLAGSSDQDHAVGVVVEFIYDVVQHQEIVDSLALLVDEDDTTAINTTNVVTPAGTQTLTNKTLTSPTINTPTMTSATTDDLQVTGEAYFDAEVDDGNSGTADTIDWTTGNKHKSTVTGDVTYTFTAPSGVCNLILKLVNGGSQTITWPGTVLWPGGTEPTWTTSGTDIVAFYYDGTNYYGQAGANFS